MAHEEASARAGVGSVGLGADEVRPRGPWSRLRPSLASSPSVSRWEGLRNVHVGPLRRRAGRDGGGARALDVGTPGPPDAGALQHLLVPSKSQLEV